MYRIDLGKNRNSIDSRVLEVAIADLKKIILDGLRHGFFEYSISCEKIPEKKLRMVIKAGKSYIYIISERELN